MDRLHVTHNSTDIIQALSCLLSRFAAKGKLKDADENGIEIRHEPGSPLVYFYGVTRDDVEFGIEVDMRTVDRAYVLVLVQGLQENLYKHRAQRTPIEVRPLAGAVSEALH